MTDFTERIRRTFGPWLMLGILCVCGMEIARAAPPQPRIKDITHIQGVKAVQLIGQGLVTGLDGTGDSSNLITSTFLKNMLQRLGNNIPVGAVRAKNAAAVIVRATLPPYAKPGTVIDVDVDSMLDARSLQGGTLQTTLLAVPTDTRKQVYAIASGRISVGGFRVGNAQQRVQKNHTTAGIVPGGGVVEKQIPVELTEDGSLTLVLYHDDFTTATNIAKAINQHKGMSIATTLDAATIKVRVPEEAQQALSPFIAEITSLRVPVDNRALVVINERTGTLVIGQHVQISEVAITHGNLHVEVSERSEIVQPSPFTQGETALQQNSAISVVEEDDMLHTVPESTTIQDVVEALNALGATPRDLVAIIQNIDHQGALHGRLIIR